MDCILVGKLFRPEMSALHGIYYSVSHKKYYTNPMGAPQIAFSSSMEEIVPDSSGCVTWRGLTCEAQFDERALQVAKSTQ